MELEIIALVRSETGKQFLCLQDIFQNFLQVNKRFSVTKHFQILLIFRPRRSQILSYAFNSYIPAPSRRRENQYTFGVSI